VRILEAPVNTTTVQTLVACARVKALGEATSSIEGTELSIRFSISSKFASFVAVETRTIAAAASTELVTIEHITPAPQPFRSMAIGGRGGGGGLRLFGKAKKAPSPTSTRAKIKDTLDVLGKRGQFLEQKAASAFEGAKEMHAKGDTKGTLRQMKLKKQYEA
jgi:hypothetical protein